MVQHTHIHTDISTCNAWNINKIIVSVLCIIYYVCAPAEQGALIQSTYKHIYRIEAEESM